MDKEREYADIHLVSSFDGERYETSTDTDFRGTDRMKVHIIIALLTALGVKDWIKATLLCAAACAALSDSEYDSVRIDCDAIKRAAGKTRREGTEDEESMADTED